MTIFSPWQCETLPWKVELPDAKNSCKLSNNYMLPPRDQSWVDIRKVKYWAEGELPGCRNFTLVNLKLYFNNLTNTF